MARKTKFQGAKRRINAFFKDHKNKVFSRGDIEEVLYFSREKWKLPISFTTSKFIDALVKENILEEYYVLFDDDKYTKWCIPDTPVLIRVSKVRKNQYFSHYSAVVAHGLTQQLPKSYYINQQLTPKKQIDRSLTQNAIDQAFSRPFRETSRIGGYLENTSYGRFHYLQSKFSEDAGVIKMPLNGVEVNVTNLERTLLDITVSPENAGGVFQVLEAYSKAASQVSINKLMAYLKKLDYIYPHHQRIGFYMERSGQYTKAQLSRVQKLNREFKFYLTHNMKEKEYSDIWKIYHPKGL